MMQEKIQKGLWIFAYILSFVVFCVELFFMERYVVLVLYRNDGQWNDAAWYLYNLLFSPLYVVGGVLALFLVRKGNNLIIKIFSGVLLIFSFLLIYLIIPK